MKLSALLFLSIVLAHASTAQAQPQKKSSKPRTAVSKSIYASTPIDVDAENLPPNYRGHSCRSIAKKLSSLKLEKSEFETTAAYEDRLASLATLPVSGAVLLKDAVAFIPEVSLLTEKYDADQGTLNVQTYWGLSIQVLNSSLVLSEKIESDLRSAKTYEAANAYGRKVLVQSSSYDTCGIAFANHKSREHPPTSINESFTMAPDEARSAKGNLTLIYIGTFAKPDHARFVDTIKPTIDRPREILWSGDAVVIDLAQIWIINRTTGTVYKKLFI